MGKLKSVANRLLTIITRPLMRRLIVKYGPLEYTNILLANATKDEKKEMVSLAAEMKGMFIDEYIEHMADLTIAAAFKDWGMDIWEDK